MSIYEICFLSVSAALLFALLVESDIGVKLRNIRSSIKRKLYMRKFDRTYTGKVHFEDVSQEEFNAILNKRTVIIRSNERNYNFGDRLYLQAFDTRARRGAEYGLSRLVLPRCVIQLNSAVPIDKFDKKLDGFTAYTFDVITVNGSVKWRNKNEF